MDTIEKESMRLKCNLSTKNLFSFSVSSLCVIACSIVSAIPVPMMSIWTRDLLLTTSNIAMTIFSYLAGSVIVLLFFSRLSNFFGRKPVVVLSLILGIISSLLFLLTHSAAGLNCGRFFQGLYCGFTTSAAMSWVIDNAPKDKVWLGTTLTVAGPYIGLSIGTLFTGIVIQESYFDPGMIFGATIILLLVLVLFVLLSSETMPFGSEALRNVLIPKIGVPRRLIKIFLLCAIGFIGTWGITSFFQGFSAKIAEIVFNVNQSSAFFAALTYLFLIVPNAISGIYVGRFNPLKIIPWAVTLFLISGIFVFWAVHIKSPVLFCVFIFLCGIMMGALCSALFKLLLSDVEMGNRASVISLLYLSAYIGSGIPNFVIGNFRNDISMDMIGYGFIVWFMTIWLLSMIFYIFVKIENKKYL